MRRRSMLTQERKTLMQASLVSPYTLLTKHGGCPDLGRAEVHKAAQKQPRHPSASNTSKQRYISPQA